MYVHESFKLGYLGHVVCFCMVWDCGMNQLADRNKSVFQSLNLQEFLNAHF